MELRMSRKERDRLRAMERIEQGLMSQVEAGRAMKLSARQVRRVVARWRAQGDAGLVHRLRGRGSNRKIACEVRARAARALAERYLGFGPTLASEYLAEEQGILVSRETVRRWMMEEGLWRGSRPRRPHRHRRRRRSCQGELVQMDTSIHDWLEGRGESAVLISMIDDATSRVFQRFFPADTTPANMELMRDYVARFGRPLAFYTDWASHFKHTPSRGQDRALAGRRTQIERALGELGIELIAAHSPQAKGRVERLFGREQDRLVKALRLKGVSTIQGANDFLQRHYLDRSNARFGVRAVYPSDLHRSGEGYDLEAIFSLQQTRSVAQDYTVQFRGQTFQIEAGEIAGGLRGTRVVVEERLDGSLRLRWRDRYLRHRRILGATPAPLREGGPSLGLRPRSGPPSRKPWVPPPDHPWKRTFLLCAKKDSSTVR
jgi:transposase